MVNSILAFRDWMFYNLIILIKLCKNRDLSLYKALLFPKTSLFVWKIENFVKLKFCARFLLNHVRKRVFRISFILVGSSVINKKCKKRVCRNQVFFVFANNSRSKQNNKIILNIVLQTFISKKHLRSSGKNIDFYCSWSLSEFSIF